MKKWKQQRKKEKLNGNGIDFHSVVILDLCFFFCGKWKGFTVR